MRRKDKEITDKSLLESVLQESKVCRIGLSRDNEPYVVPVIFAYKENCIYFHSAHEGKKIDIIQQNNRVCVEIDALNGVVAGKKACLFGLKYISVIASGKASFITDLDEKSATLDLLMQKYSDQTQWSFFPTAVEKMNVIKIELDELTGKESK
jgi:nitroimidazol reductase NimA-like FMN-containing flavoprotein (pyridoxamine 5'-phosphate oxidase superfamily)